jgi:rare lipoprotein A (peptidoglycan hydrolase)
MISSLSKCLQHTAPWQKIIITSVFCFGFFQPVWSDNPTPSVNNKINLMGTLSLSQKVSNTVMPIISVKESANRNVAMLLINGKPALQMKSTEMVDASEQLQHLSHTLAEFLSKGGNPRDIQPAEIENTPVIMARTVELIRIEKPLAQAQGQSPKAVTMSWINALRIALGADTIDRTPREIASRGFSPTVPSDLSPQNRSEVTGWIQRGMASWYGPGFEGKRCANGERFNMEDLTAAHRTLPFNTRVRVTNPATRQTAIVRITDRGPFSHRRIIDLSKGAAKAVGLLSSGTGPVMIEILKR